MKIGCPAILLYSTGRETYLSPDRASCWKDALIAGSLTTKRNCWKQAWGNHFIACVITYMLCRICKKSPFAFTCWVQCLLCLFCCAWASVGDAGSFPASASFGAFSQTSLAQHACQTESDALSEPHSPRHLESRQVQAATTALFFTVLLHVEI